MLQFFCQRPSPDRPGKTARGREESCWDPTRFQAYRAYLHSQLESNTIDNSSYKPSVMVLILCCYDFISSGILLVNRVRYLSLGLGYDSCDSTNQEVIDLSVEEAYVLG